LLAFRGDDLADRHLALLPMLAGSWLPLLDCPLRLDQLSLLALEFASSTNPDASQRLPHSIVLHRHLQRTRRAFRQELWIEVTVPPQGPPRPLQMAVKDNGVWKPL